MSEKDVQELIQTLKERPDLKERLTEVLSMPPAAVTGKASLLDGRFEAILAAIQQLREDFGQRFEAMDKRFEAMDKRFEAMDKRFEAMDKRFEAMDKRFEAMIEEFRAFRQKLGVVEERFGFTLEELAADRLPRYFKAKEGWTVDYPASRDFRTDGRTVEVDLVAEARKGKRRAILVCEVKSRIAAGDVRGFRERIESIPELKGAQLLPVICGLLIDPSAEQEGRRLDVRVLRLRGLA